MIALVVPALLASVFLLAACGDDDDSSSNAASSGGGSDAGYVAAVCKAQLSLQNVLKDLKPDDTSKAGADKLDTALAAYVKALESAKPPSDGKAYHDIIVKYFKDAQAKIKGKGPAALDSVGDPPASPKDVSARLDKIAANNKDCTDSGFSFSD